VTSKKQDGSEFPHFGDIFDVHLNPVVGSEVGKIRPVLIISNDMNNRYAATITILPLTSSPAKKVYPFEVGIPKGTAGLLQDSRIKANQIRTVDKKRILHHRGTLPAKYVEAVQVAVKIHLNMNIR